MNPVSEIIYESDRTGWGHSGTWYFVPSIDLGHKSSVTCSLQIYWRDVSITFYLVRSNFNYPGNPTTLMTWENFTASYRVVDPAWVDPVKGDAYSQHIVSFQNIGTRYVNIGWSASDWTGVIGPYLAIALFYDRRV